MDARIARVAVMAAAALISTGANYRTKNFVVSAPTPQMAEEIGLAAEAYRKELAREWLGQELRPWAKPCPIVAQVGERLGAGGATSFVFDHGEVFGWQMNIQGTYERILDSVLPHEITHTVFASHFRQPLPRWADEGACTTVEHASERAKQHQMLVEFLKTRRGIAFNQMFAMKEYPRDVLPLYSQGYSLARYLIFQHGRREFVAFLEDGLQGENWPQAISEHYGYRNLGVLQESWLAWVREGSPALAAGNDRLEGDAAVVLASHRAPRVNRSDADGASRAGRRESAEPAEPMVVRGNSPDGAAPAANAYALAPARPPVLIDRQAQAEGDWRSVKRTARPSSPREDAGPRGPNWDDAELSSSSPRPGSARADVTGLAHPAPASAPSDDPFLANHVERSGAAEVALAQSANPARPGVTSAADAASPRRPGASQAYQATRPQQPEPVRQTILEWSRDATLVR